MLLTTLVNTINSKLAGELLSYQELLPFLDDAIDSINAELNTVYPCFSDLETGVTEYNLFPDVYLRRVVVPYTAWAYYVSDEEGEQTAAQFQLDYAKGLFIMKRDMLYNVPLEYQAPTGQGYMVDNPNAINGERGVFVDGSDFFI